MGIPKFFRWISERYPLCSQLIADDLIPEFDFFYLDMNGIIHHCAKGYNSIRVDEKLVFDMIFDYIKILIDKIRPRKLVFLAIDGVAPRAKMNQQRSRRFRAAAETELLKTKIKEKGDTLSEVFDGNCITPGTEFMHSLCKALRLHLFKYISSNSTPWCGDLQIILSGPDVPGEGEHKIMDFIRGLQSHPDYSPSSRHCLYGLDADLIMLGLVSHEKNFALLREEVTFGRNKNANAKPASPLHIRFYLLYIGLLREYMNLEFSDKEINIEHFADDFVFFSVLLGNDFLPHIPYFHINENAYEVLFESYKQSRLNGAMNDLGSINSHTVLDFLRILQVYEYNYFISQRVQDPETPTIVDAHTFFQFRIDFAASASFANFLSNSNELFWTATKYISLHMRASIQKLCLHSGLEFGLNEEHSIHVKKSRDWKLNKTFRIEDFLRTPHLIELSDEFTSWKQSYYAEKFEVDSFSSEIYLTKPIEALILEYCKGLQWVMAYYYYGVSSWNWYYPYHYAPFISDVADYIMLSDKSEAIFKSDQQLGTPFRPLEQLLAVLPSASAPLVPYALSTLMTDPLTSPIIDFYPLKFEIDLNGKKNDWEAIVKIPFIQEDRLLKAISERESRLTAFDIERSKSGEALLFKPNTRKTDFGERGLIFKLDMNDLTSLEVVCNRAYTSMIPSLSFLTYSPRIINNSGVCVFNYPSKNTSIFIHIHDNDISLNGNPASVLGKTVLVNYPFVQKAVAMMYSDPLLFYDKHGVIPAPTTLEKFEFETFVQQAKKKLWKSYGIVVKSEPKFIYWVRLCRISDGSTGSKEEDLFPVLPSLISIAPIDNPRVTQGVEIPSTKNEILAQLGLGEEKDASKKDVGEANKLRKSHIMSLFSKIQLD